MQRFVLVLLAVAVASGCGTERAGAPAKQKSAMVGEAACVLAVEFRGHTYVGSGVHFAPPEGAPVGTATLPPCNDTPGAVDDTTAQSVPVSELDGVDPDVALVWHGRGDVVLIRDDVDQTRLPAALAELMRSVRCRATDEPIRLVGDWRGILAADGGTERDLVPPYDLSLLVTSAEPPRYERAFISVRVPASLGRPLDRGDLESSLWRGGTIEATAHCDHGAFVAEHVAAKPPR